MKGRRGGEGREGELEDGSVPTFARAEALGLFLSLPPVRGYDNDVPHLHVLLWDAWITDQGLTGDTDWRREGLCVVWRQDTGALTALIWPVEAPSVLAQDERKSYKEFRGEGQADCAPVHTQGGCN